MKEKLVNTTIIIKYMKDNKLTKKQFCSLCNIEFSEFNKLLKHNYDIDIDILLKIARLLNINLSELF